MLLNTKQLHVTLSILYLILFLKTIPPQEKIVSNEKWGNSLVTVDSGGVGDTSTILPLLPLPT